MAFKDLGLNAWPNVGDSNTDAISDWLENSETLGDYLEAGIPSDGIKPDAALDMLTYGLDNVGYINMEQWTPSGTYSIGFNSSGEFVVRDGAGNSVALTSGGTINFASVGGIGGDYGLGSETVTYDDSGKKYIFKDSTTARAQIDCEDILHQDRVVKINHFAYQSGGAGLAFDAVNGALEITNSAAQDMSWAIPVPVGSRIVSVSVRASQVTAGSPGDSTLYLFSTDDAAAPTTIDSDTITDDGGYMTVSLAGASPESVSSGTTYYLTLDMPNLTGTVTIPYIEVTIDKIA